MKTIIKILSAFAVVSATFIIIDIAFGKVLDYVTRNKGLTKQNYVMSGRDKYDLLFIGSSRSNHHYDTSYITDSLKLKSFNAGEDGRGLTYQYPELYAYLTCHTPDVIVLDVLPNLDGEWKNRIAMLYPLANKYDIIIKTAEKVDLKNKYLLLSNLYRYNSNIPSELYGVRYPFKATENYGYVPISIKKSRVDTLKEDSIVPS